MPIYEYECPEHGRFEELRALDAGNREPCPDCGIMCKKVLSTFSFAFDTLNHSQSKVLPNAKIVGG